MTGKQILIAILGVIWAIPATAAVIQTNGTIREANCVENGGSYVVVANTDYKECRR